MPRHSKQRQGVELLPHSTGWFENGDSIDSSHALTTSPCLGNDNSSMRKQQQTEKSLTLQLSTVVHRILNTSHDNQPALTA